MSAFIDNNETKLENISNIMIKFIKPLNSEIEYTRYVCVEYLYKYYSKLIFDNFGWHKPPKSSLNRFFINFRLHMELENLIVEDPILPILTKDGWISKSLIIEITPPIKYVKGMYNLKNHIRLYIGAIKKSFKYIKNVHKIILENYLNEFKWWNVSQYNELYEYYENFRNLCHDVYIIAWYDKTVNIIKDLIVYSTKLVEEIKSLKYPNIESDVELINNKFIINEKYISDTIQQRYIESLKLKFIGGDVSNFKNFLCNLIYRYKSFLYPEGYGLQVALPHNVFEMLIKKWDITCKIFASPFNAYMPTYCSAFLDTDIYFGKTNFVCPTGISLGYLWIYWIIF